MATLSDLPYELLYDILRLAMPEDLENFAQISKRVQEVAKPLLQDHRALIRKYRCLTSWLKGGRATSLLLGEILTTPRVSHYVREAKVDFDHNFRTRERYTKSEIEWLLKLTAESMNLPPYLDATAVQLLRRDVGFESEIATFAVLLPFLPNLEILWIRDTGTLYDRWIPNALSNACTGAKPCLTKLARICFKNDRRSTRAYFSDLRLYAALPSVRELLSDVNISWDYGKDALPYLDSGITTLELTTHAYTADPSRLLTFLKDFPKLEVLKVSFVNRLPYKASKIKDTLLSTVKTSLRMLTIIGPGGDRNFMGSLREFRVLTELHTSWSMLVKHNRKLQALLPASLQRIKLDDSMTHSAGTYAKVLRGILLSNDLGYLHIKNVTFTLPGFGPLNKSCHRLQQFCYRQGLTLAFEHRGK